MEGELSFCFGRCKDGRDIREMLVYQDSEMTEFCLKRWCLMKSDPGLIGHQSELSRFKQTSLAADKKGRLHSQILLRPAPCTSRRTRTCLRWQPPLSRCWPRLGVIHPGQPITFLRGCKKRDAPACEFFTWGGSVLHTAQPLYTLT